MTASDLTQTNVGTRTKILIYRHSVLVRLSHWINVVCLTFLLLSGLQIFLAHPFLHWGQFGADTDPSFVEIGAENNGALLSGFARVGTITVTTTGVLGISQVNGVLRSRAFPSWITLPGSRNLGMGRRWHFFVAWLFVFNGLTYLAYGFLQGHFRRDLLPTPAEVSPAHLTHEIVEHAKLRFPKGEKARQYNALQKLAYLIVVFLLLPAMLMTGLTMSPGLDAALPWLVDLFGGRQSARSIHFITASLLVLFVVVHIVMVLASGVWNNLRSMITGHFQIEP